MYPSSIVEQVWNLHRVLGGEYREFARKLKIQPFWSDSIGFVGDIEGVVGRYEETLRVYEKVFCNKGVVRGVWEGVIERFYVNKQLGDSAEMMVRKLRFWRCVNVFRLIATTSLRGIKEGYFNQKDIKCTMLPSHKETTEGESVFIIFIVNNRRKERERYIKENQLYGWRQNFPNCANVYVSKTYEVEKEYEISGLNLPVDKNSTIYEPGGVLILSNIFSKRFLENSIEFSMFEMLYDDINK